MSDVSPSKTVNLPTWEQCKLAVDRDEATPLEAFIYENEPVLTDKAQDFVRKCIPNYSRRADEQFRGMLSDLIAFVSNAHETQVVHISGTAVEQMQAYLFETHGLKYSLDEAKRLLEGVLLPAKSPTSLPAPPSLSPELREKFIGLIAAHACSCMTDGSQVHQCARCESLQALNADGAELQRTPEQTALAEFGANNERCEHGVPRRFCTADHTKPKRYFDPSGQDGGEQV